MSPPPLPSLDELRRERDRLLAEACPYAVEGEKAPVALDAATQALLIAGYDPSKPMPFSADVATFAETALRATPEGKRERLLIETNLLRRVVASGEAQIHRAPYGLVEGIFPVVQKGRVVHVLTTGPMKQGVWTDVELATLRKVFAIKSDVLEQARALPSLTEGQVNQVFDLKRNAAVLLQRVLDRPVHPPTAPQAMSPSSVDELNYGLAHHLNNLLSIILGYASFLQNREEGKDRDVSSAIRIVCDTAQKARRVTTEWLSFSNHAAERVSLVRVHDVVLGVLALLEPRNAGRVRFTTQFKATSDTIAALPSAVQRVVFNMLVTAIDSLPAAGGLIGIKTKNVKAEPDDPTGVREFLRIEVADSGGLATLPGVDPLVAELLAMETRQEEDSEGGLYAMVRELEGSIMISTDQNAVTKVEVLLPLCSEDEFNTVGRKVRPRQTASQIWVVDDDPVFADMCADILRGDGHHVAVFHDSIALRERWGHPDERPDLVLYDHNLPEASGLEIREWMQEAGITTPLLLVSGMASSQADIRDALSLRKTHYLRKPFSARELLDVVSVAMGETLVES